MAAAKLKGYYAEQAKERMRAGGKKAGNGRPAEKGVVTSPPPTDEGDARDQAAALLGAFFGGRDR